MLGQINVKRSRKEVISRLATENKGRAMIMYRQLWFLSRVNLQLGSQMNWLLEPVSRSVEQVPLLTGFGGGCKG